MRSEMTQAIMDAVNAVLGDISVAMPATVIAYDTGTGLVNAQPFGKLRKPDGTLMDYPIITGVPICQPSGIAAPVSAGIQCLLVICDTDIAGWIAGQAGSPSLRHSISNAICIPGLQRTATAAQNVANSKNCVAISGNLYVDGSVTCTGNCNAPNI